MKSATADWGRAPPGISRLVSGISMTPTLPREMLPGAVTSMKLEGFHMSRTSRLASLVLCLFPALLGAQTIDKFTVPEGDSYLMEIAGAGDGSMWFTMYVGNAIGRVTTSGSIEIVGSPRTTSGPTGIAVGADGSIFFSEWWPGVIARR